MEANVPPVSAPAGESNASLANADQWPEYNEYRPLRPDEIRLMDIEAGIQPVCNLRVVNLKQQPDYHALSYYWGAPVVPSELKAVKVDKSQVMLRPNIYSFLWHLTARFGSITVWFDVLCINQKDTTERSQQVAMMGNIYSAATSVYVWLGDGDADSNYAFDYVNKNGRHGPIPSQYFEQIILRPYWTRLWVIQEFALAKRISIICGNRMASWEDFQQITSHLTPDVASRSPEYKQFAQLRDLRGTQNLLSLMSSHTLARCSDLRDKAYGFRALAIDGQRLVVDYSKSIGDLFFKLVSINPPHREGSMVHSLGYVNLLQPHLPFSSRDLVRVLDSHETDRLFYTLRRVGVVAEILKYDAEDCPSFAFAAFAAKLTVKRHSSSGIPNSVVCEAFSGGTVQIGDVVYSVDYNDSILSPLLLVMRADHQEVIECGIAESQTIPLLKLASEGLGISASHLVQHIWATGVQPCRADFSIQHDYIIVHISRALYILLWIISRKEYSSLTEVLSVNSILGRKRLCYCGEETDAILSQKEDLLLQDRAVESPDDTPRGLLSNKSSLSPSASEPRVFRKLEYRKAKILSPDTVAEVISHITATVEKWLKETQRATLLDWLKSMDLPLVPEVLKMSMMIDYGYVVGTKLPSPSYPDLKGGFSSFCKDIRLVDGHYLQCRCPYYDGEYILARLNLSGVLANHDGNFEWVEVVFVRNPRYQHLFNSIINPVWSMIYGSSAAEERDDPSVLLGQELLQLQTILGVSQQSSWESWIPLGVGHGGFETTARNIRLVQGGRILQAELQTTSGEWRQSQVNLDEAILSIDGKLAYVLFQLANETGIERFQKWYSKRRPRSLLPV